MPKQGLSIDILAQGKEWDDLGLHESRDLPKLRALGVTTLEDFVGLAQVLAQDLSDFLGLEDLGPLTIFAAGRLPAAQINAEADLIDDDYAFGVSSPTAEILMQRPSLAPKPQIIPAAGINLISGMPHVRDQNPRKTSVAYATLAILEFLERSTTGGFVNLSEEFLYWNCKQSGGISEKEGTFLRTSFPLLRSDGVCEETIWPYDPHHDPINLSIPPPNARGNALSHRARSVVQLNPASVNDIKQELTGGFINDEPVPVAVSIPVYRTWFRSPRIRSTGELILPLPSDVVPEGGHAICLVGYEDDIDYPGGGFFIFRNSWGTHWAMNNRFAPGYGTVPYEYITKFAWEAWTISRI